MSRKSDLQFIADTAFLRKMALVESGLEKRAGILSNLIGGVEGQLSNEVSSVTQAGSPGGAAEGIMKMMEPAVLLKISPVLGIFDVIAQMFGFSITGVVFKIINALKPKIESGQPVTTEDVNNIGIAAAGGLQSASSDLLFDWREVADRGELLKLFKEAAPATRSYYSPRSSMFGMSGGGGPFSWLYRLFSAGSPFDRTRQHSFLLALPIWIVKTVLKGAGLLAIGAGIKSMITGKKPATSRSGESAMGQPVQREVVSNIPHFPDIKPNSFKASGNGEDVHQNDENRAWYAPISGDVQQTLINWSIQVYPELANRQNDIVKSVSFNRMVNILNSYVEGSYINVPIGLETRKQIVDRFAGDIPAIKKVK